MMLLLYNLSIRLYGLIIWLISPFNSKAKKWLTGRKGWETRLKQQVEKRSKDQPCLWIHCASLGEFEQGRPIIEKLKKEKEDLFVVLSFFSPSGYEIRKNYKLADVVTYLPLDTKNNAQKFVSIVQPNFSIFVKYEFWHYFLHHLEKQNIPTYLISAAFRSNQLFFKPYGKFFRSILHRFVHIFVQNENSFQLLQNIGLNQISISGDTRIDRVIDISQTPKELPILDQFCGEHPIWVVGSSWPADEEMIFEYLHNKLPENWKLVIAPHDISKKHIESIQKKLEVPHIAFSKAANKNLDPYRVLIIDNIGMLAFLYRYGQFAYIGGGFGEGIHNTLEAIVYGLPVVFGPKHKKFDEALFLVQNKGGFSISNQEEFDHSMAYLLNEETRKKASAVAMSYIHKNKGASEKITQYLLESHF